VFALIGLWSSLHATAGMGWRSLIEMGSDTYVGYAVSLVQGQGYLACPVGGAVECEGPPGGPPTAYRLPGYPLFLAVAMLGFGTADLLPALRLLQSAMLAAVVYLTVGAAVKLRGQLAGAAAGAGLLYVDYLNDAASLLQTEMLFTLLLIILVHVLLWRSRHSVVIGALLAVLMLTRGVLVFTTPLLFLLIPRRQWAVVAGTMLWVFAPWWLRNYLALHAWVPFSTGVGDVMWGANNDMVQGNWLNPRLLPGWEHLKTLSEAARNQAEIGLALDWIRAQPPVELARLVLWKWLLLLYA
jgi:hypothetical protein